MPQRFDHTKIRRAMDDQGRRNVWLIQWMAAFGYEVSEAYASMILDGQRPVPQRFGELAARALAIPTEFLLADETEPAHAD